MRALLLRKGKKEVDRREGRGEEGICRTNVNVLPTPLSCWKSRRDRDQTLGEYWNGSSQTIGVSALKKQGNCMLYTPVEDQNRTKPEVIRALNPPLRMVQPPDGHNRVSVHAL